MPEPKETVDFFAQLQQHAGLGWALFAVAVIVIGVLVYLLWSSSGSTAKVTAPATATMTHSGNASVHVNVGRSGDPDDTAERRKARREVRDAIAAFMHQGNGIVRDCLANKPKDELKVAVDQWAEKAFAYLGTLESSFQARFNAAEMPRIAVIFMGTSQEAGRMSEFVNARIRVLESILQELKD
jgi:hypothetical protein